MIRNFIAPARAFVERGRLAATRGMPAFSRGEAADERAAFARAARDPVTTEALQRAGLGTPANARQKIADAFGRAIELLGNRAELAALAKQGTLDQFAGIDRAVRRDIGNLPVEQDPYIAARLANGGASSVMRALLLHGQARWAANGQHLEKIPGTVGLLDVLSPLGDDLHDWFGWMIGNRAARLKREGRENNFTDDQIKTLQALATPEKRAAFQKAATQYAAFKRSVLDIGEAAGLINPETRKSWDYADYIPFYRHVDEAGLTSGIRSFNIPQRAMAAVGKKGLEGQSSGIRVLRGGSAALNDPIENLLLNFSRLVDASLKNRAIAKTVGELAAANSNAVAQVGYNFGAEVIPSSQVRTHLLEAGMHPDVLDVIPPEAFDGMAKMWAIKAPADPDVVRVMAGGKPTFWRVSDPLLLRALTSFVPFDFPGLRLMRGAKRLLTGLVTSTPDFIIRNWIRDSAATQAIGRDWFNPAQSVTGIAKAYSATGAAEAMLFAGASFGSGQYNAADPEGTATEIRTALRRRGMSASSVDGFLATVLDTPARVWERWHDISAAVENANREAVYEAATNAGRSTTAAAYEAKDLMDFNLRGSWPAYQLLADVLPFFNARVQGLYRLGRADPVRLATVGTIIMAASLMLAMANDGQDWYEELPDWDKDTCWHFKIKGHHFRIPKPFEVGVMFATIPERIGRAIKGLDTHSKTQRRLWSNVRDQLAFDPLPQLVRPVVNVWANWDSFRDRPIESMRDLGKENAYRYSANTSDTMRRLSLDVLNPLSKPFQKLGAADAFGLSPKDLEYLVNGYFGTIGLYAMGLSDMLVRRLEGKPPGPSLRADDIPVVRSFYRLDPARATVFESDLYRMNEAVEKIAHSFKAMNKERSARAQQILDEDHEKLAVHRIITNAVKQLAKLNQQRDQIYADPKMTPEQKRQAVDALQVQKNAIAKQTATLPAVKAAF